MRIVQYSTRPFFQKIGVQMVWAQQVGTTLQLFPLPPNLGERRLGLGHFVLQVGQRHKAPITMNCVIGEIPHDADTDQGTDSLTQGTEKGGAEMAYRRHDRMESWGR